MLRSLHVSAAIAAVAVGSSPPAAAEPVEEGAAELELEPDSRREPNRLLAAAEVALIVATGGVEYWIRHDGRPRYQPSTWVDRFSTTRWLILDTSTFATNYSYHTAAGAGYHLATRTSDLGIFESALYSLAASFVWEYIVEYREKVDLNDMLFTTPAGISLGEFGHALGRLVHQRPSGPGWNAARWTLGFPQSFNDGLQGLGDARGPEVAHRLRVSAGASRATGRTTRGGATDRDHRGLYQLRLGGRLARMDGLDRPGARWRGFADGNFTSLDAVLTADAGGYRGTYLLSDTFLAGWRYSEIADDADRGRAINLGSAVAVRYQRERFGGWRDRLGAAHLPGLAADGALWGPAWRLEGAARLHPDYGGVGALSHRDWAAAHPGEVGLSSLAEQGYYHALGVSGRLRAQLTVPHVTAGAELFAGRYRPHYDRDKRRSELTIEQRIASRAADYGVWLRGRFAGPWYVEARLEGRHRWERFEELDATARLVRAGVELGASF